ncbi:MAG: NUDIX hydrolase [Candidatus Komeilibacteria bacterium]|nr:NUDIX hydrolase [Candidatus Komeilibacteria bacterium]
MKLKWKKIKEKSYQVGYRKIVRKTFELPDGKIVDFDIKQEGPAVCVLAITQENNIILAKQYRPGPEKVLVEMPGGKVETGESAKFAIKRELLEETGYTGKFIFVGTTLDCAYSSMIRYNFLGINCQKIQEPISENNEFIEVIEMSINRFRKELKKGQMTDIESGYLCLNFLDDNFNLFSI